MFGIKSCPAWLYYLILSVHSVRPKAIHPSREANDWLWFALVDRPPLHVSKRRPCRARKEERGRVCVCVDSQRSPHSLHLTRCHLTLPACRYPKLVERSKRRRQSLSSPCAPRLRTRTHAQAATQTLDHGTVVSWRGPAQHHHELLQRAPAHLSH